MDEKPPSAAAGAQAAKPEEGKKLPTSINFDYIKGNLFRVVHADGAFGGVAPNGEGFVISFYSERGPLPTRTTYELQPTGALGKEISRQARDAVVREIEFAVAMNPRAAEVFHKWLGEKLKQFKTMSETAAATAKKQQELT